MADLLNFDELLAPIDGDNPAGVDLREDYSPTSVYVTVKSARNAARAAERRQVEGDESATPDWSPILEGVPEAIAKQSKDLELACWLTEALLRKHGFAGLRDGFRLARQLVEQYWDGLYPLPDEDGIESRVATLAGLNGLEGGDGTLIGPINNVPLTGESPAGEGPYAGWQYKQAQNLEGMEPEKRQERVDRGAVSMEMIERAEAATPPDQMKELLEELSESISEFDGLCALLEEKCGKDESGMGLAPPSSTIRNALKECRDIVEAVVGVEAPEPAAEGEAADGLAAEPGAPGARAGVSVAAGQIGSREDAFKALLKVAQFFKETEPHSPVSYALERIVKWGRLSLPDLFAELIADESTRTSVFKLIGIPPPESEGEY